MADAPEVPQEKRTHRRVKTRLLGRYLLADGRESKGTVTDISLSGIGISAGERGQVGETVIVYIDQAGRVEGKIVRFLEDGFALELTGNARTTEKLSRRLVDLQANCGLSRIEERRQEPRVKTDDELGLRSLAEGAEYGVFDLSVTGADLKVSGHRPPIGALVKVGRLRGKVVRHSEVGVGIEFVDMPDGITLTDLLAGDVPKFVELR